MKRILKLFLLLLVGYSAFSQPGREDLENAIEMAFKNPKIARFVYATPADGIRKATIYANDLFLHHFPARYDSDWTSESGLSLGRLRPNAAIYVVEGGLQVGEADVITTFERIDIGLQGNAVELEMLTSPFTTNLPYPCAHILCTLENKNGIWKVTKVKSRKVRCDKSRRPRLTIIDLR